MVHAPDAGNYDRRYVNLASAKLGAAALLASDEFFGAKERMLDDAPPVFIPQKYDQNGKWMDGWESIRRRGPGHDSCVVRLAVPGTIKAVDLDTTHFTGNYPHAASLEATVSSCDPDAWTSWTELLPPTGLQGNSHHIIPLKSDIGWTHVRLHIYPDGGIARLRLYGVPTTLPVPDRDGLIDLASALAGTRVVAFNDSHFGDPRHLLLPGIGARMEDGWETRRRRDPGNDWAILALGHPGTLHRAEIDTTEFKGNFPDQASLQAALIPGMSDEATVPLSMFWPELLPPQKLGPNRQHVFTMELNAPGPVSHVRFNIFPDGGINRLRLFGKVMT